MGKKLSELVEATTVAITDIFHLRTTGGIDKKIILNNIFGVGVYGTKLTGQGVGGLPIFEPVSRVRVTKNNAQSIPNASATIVQYDDEVFDNLGEFTSYEFTALKAGYYFITASLVSAIVEYNFDEYWQISIYKNGVLYSHGFVYFTASLTRPSKSTINDIIYLAATDYIDIRCYQTQGAAVNTSTIAADNYFAVHRLS